MAIDVQFVDFPKPQNIRDIVMTRFDECLTHLNLAKEVHLNLVFKHVHFTTIEFQIKVSGDKIHKSIKVVGHDVPHAIDEGIKKLKAILHKISDKMKTQHHAGRERRGHPKRNNENE